MEITINVMSEKATINSILMFQTDKESMYWRKPLFKMYPFLDKKRGLQASWKNRKKYLTLQFNDFYRKNETELHAKVKLFDNYWQINKGNVTKIFTDAFGIDCNSLFNDITAEVSLNPICPRNISNHSFTVFYQSDENRFLETAIHEIIHFVWFYIWHKHFNDSRKNYEGPHLKWVLSEMVVDTFVNNTGIGNLFSQESRGNVAYRYFYTMKIHNTLILETLSQIYQESQNVMQFMEQAYKYCQDNEQAIREQML